MRSDAEIQFAPAPAPPADTPSEPPEWIGRLIEWLSDLFSPVANALAGGWDVLFWIIAAAGAGLVLFAIYRLIDPQILRRSRKPDEDGDWTPGQDAALALLEEADRLAQEGRFDEATHLLLQRSVGQIAAVRPDLIDPSSTAREIAALPALPAAARTAFATIAERVERSLFALSQLSAEDWQAARGAYAEFALGYRGLKG